MRVEELRVGNWVHDKTHKRYVKIDGFEPNHDIVWVDYDNGNAQYKLLLYYIKPIPLTEEILLKCGFEKSAWDNYSTFRNMFCSEGCVVISLEHSCIEIGDLMLDINIKYLHQLQNLYFALTNKELEIEL